MVEIQKETLKAAIKKSNSETTLCAVDKHSPSWTYRTDVSVSDYHCRETARRFVSFYNAHNILFVTTVKLL